MKRVYKVTYDIKVPKVGWAANGSTNGWAAVNVLVNGDARDASAKAVRMAYGQKIGGKAPTAVNVINVELVVDNVL